MCTQIQLLAGQVTARLTHFPNIASMFALQKREYSEERIVSWSQEDFMSLHCVAREVRWGSSRIATCKKEAATAGYVWYSPSVSQTNSIWYQNLDEECSSTREDSSVRKQAPLAEEGVRALPRIGRALVQSSSPAHSSTGKPPPHLHHKACLLPAQISASEQKGQC